MSDRPATAYKVLTAEQMDRLETDGTFAGAPVDLADGFIHLSTSRQLDETVTKHFAGMDNLCIAAVDLAALGAAVKWEPSRGGDLFPHVYAALPLSAVIAYRPLERDDERKVKLPVAG
ncbi:MAG: DUF952 domain-containing protein [Novosphingobium sp.]